MENQQTTKKGVLIKIIGVILLLLGSIDCMLMWRGSMAVHESFYALILIGVVFIVVGNIRQKAAES